MTIQRARPAPIDHISEDAGDRRRRGRPSKFTADAVGTILAHIRAGAFPHVAAQAAGVGYSTMRAWLTSDNPAFQEFQEAYMRVVALTRVDAEQRVFRTKPLQWLKVMARSTPKGDGWSGPLYVGADSSIAHQEMTPEAIERMLQVARRIPGE